MALGNKGTAKNSSSGSSGGSHTTKSDSAPRTWFRVLWFLLLLGMVFLALGNIKPYVDAAQKLGVTIVDATFIKFISVIPVVNALAATLGIGIAWVVGTILWGTFQLIEVMPVILYNHPSFLHEVIQEAEQSTKYAIKENDDPTVANLKKVYNKLPVAFLENLSKIRLAAYVVDFCICFWFYSPVASGKITDFFYYVMTGQFSKINTNNLLWALITLFGFEIALNLLLWVGKIAWTYRKAQKNQTQY